ncbi:MAG: glycosyltransferase, partial [Actinobacteria bacterium]|nr:glycosyltransferase [Actinomycetota bacterium]
MNTSKIVILKDVRPEFASSSDALVITFEELKHWIKKGSIIKHSFRYQNARFLTHRLEVIYKPFVVAVLMRLLSRGVCRFEDEQGYRLEVNTRTLLNLFGQLVRDFMQKTAFVDQINQEVEQLSSRDQSLKATRNLDLPAVPVYLRTDLVFGLRSGGSVGHIAGVLNSLDSFTGKPIFLTTDTISTVRGDTETHLILPGQEFRDFRELPSLYLNKIFEQDALKILGNVELSFIYQRYSLNNFVGVKLAKAYGVPFVLEYNGSEIWVNRNWDRPLKYESLSERIELLNLKAADVVVVISQPLKDELVGRGIEADKILVNPNGVNPEIYSPEVDGSVIRSKYDLEG